MVFVALLYVIAIVIAVSVNLAASKNPNGNDMFPPELRDNPALASLALAGIVTFVSLFMAGLIFMIAYVNRDASRRGMNSGVWTLLVLGARFNFCPNCKCNLHPSCPQCKREIAEIDKFCPYCGNDLKSAAQAEPAA